VQAKQEALELMGTHLLPVHADDVNILGGSIHNIKKITKALVVGSKEIGLEVHVEKTKYLVMSRDQYGEQMPNKKIGSESFATVEQFKFWEQP
jgi:hypothetical protein